jgi:hypothetical protein
MKAKVFVPVAVVLGVLGVGGLIESSPNHSACNSFLVEATNESLCRADNTIYIVSWALIVVATLITLGQIASMTGSKVNPTIQQQPPLVAAPKKIIPTELTLGTELGDITSPAVSVPSSLDSPIVTRRVTKRVLLVTAGLVVIALIIASVATVGTTTRSRGNAPPTTQNTPAVNLSLGLVPEILPLQVCKTTYGIAGTKAIIQPTSLAEMVPRGNDGPLVVYSDGLGILRLLGPRGWECTADVGADGAGGVTIAPTNAILRIATTNTGILPARSTAEVIKGWQSGGCTGCAMDQACPLFAAVWNQLHKGGSKCLTAPPASETFVSLTKRVIDLTDPPGVHGDANPSGGAYLARSVLTYFSYSGEEPQSQQETCVLPKGNQSLCESTLQNFAFNYGK